MSLTSESINKIQLLKPGNSVRVHFKIKEGDKTRIQVFEGVIISRHRRTTPDATITVRRLVKGQGVERIFPLHSPLIDKIEITKIAKKIRRAKLNFLRDRQGKSARLKETVLNDRIEINLHEIFADDIDEDVTADSSVDTDIKENNTETKDVQNDEDKKEDIKEESSEETKEETKDESKEGDATEDEEKKEDKSTEPSSDSDTK